MRILPPSTIDDTKTILQVVMRLQKYLEENPIRNIFYIDEEYSTQQVAYDKTKVSIPTELDVDISADDIILFKNGYVAVVDSVGYEYVVIKANEVVSFKGERGEQGEQGEQGEPGRDGTNGTNGADGVSITGVTKTGTSGLVDTYTITFSNGTTSTFTVTNGVNGTNGTDGADGRGIVSITKTATVGLVDTYTILYSDNTTSTFTVTNGESGTFPTGGNEGDVIVADNTTNPVWRKPYRCVPKNLIINPDFLINQKNNTGTINHSSTAKDNYVVDRWYLQLGSVYLEGGLNRNMRLKSNSRLLQLIQTQPRFNRKYLLIGVTYYLSSDQVIPDIKFKNESEIEYQAIINKTITFNRTYSNVQYTYGQKYIVIDASLVSSFTNEFVIENNDSTNEAYLINAFCYSLDNINEYINDEITVETYIKSEELEKCRYYAEKIEDHYINACMSLFSTNFIKMSCGVRISEKRITPTYYNISISSTVYKNDGTSSYRTYPSPSFNIFNGNNLTASFFDSGINFSDYVKNATTFSVFVDAEIYPSTI